MNVRVYIYVYFFTSWIIAGVSFSLNVPECCCCSIFFSSTLLLFNKKKLFYFLIYCIFFNLFLFSLTEEWFYLCFVFFFTFNYYYYYFTSWTCRWCAWRQRQGWRQQRSQGQMWGSSWDQQTRRKHRHSSHWQLHQRQALQLFSWQQSWEAIFILHTIKIIITLWERTK